MEPKELIPCEHHPLDDRQFQIGVQQATIIAFQERKGITSGYQVFSDRPGEYTIGAPGFPLALACGRAIVGGECSRYECIDGPLPNSFLVLPKPSDGEGAQDA